MVEVERVGKKAKAENIIILKKAIIFLFLFLFFCELEVISVWRKRPIYRLIIYKN